MSTLQIKRNAVFKIQERETLYSGNILVGQNIHFKYSFNKYLWCLLCDFAHEGSLKPGFHTPGSLWENSQSSYNLTQ